MLAELLLEIFRQRITHFLSCTSLSYERASPLVHAENQNCTDVEFRPGLVPNSTLCSLAAVLGISGDSFVGVIDLVVATDVLVTEL